MEENGKKQSKEMIKEHLESKNNETRHMRSDG